MPWPVLRAIVVFVYQDKNTRNYVKFFCWCSSSTFPYTIYNSVHMTNWTCFSFVYMETHNTRCSFHCQADCSPCGGVRLYQRGSRFRLESQPYYRPDVLRFRRTDFDRHGVWLECWIRQACDVMCLIVIETALSHLYIYINGGGECVTRYKALHERTDNFKGVASMTSHKNPILWVWSMLQSELHIFGGWSHFWPRAALVDRYPTRTWLLAMVRPN